MNFSNSNEDSVVQKGDLTAEVLSILDQINNPKFTWGGNEKTTYRGINPSLAPQRFTDSTVSIMTRNNQKFGKKNGDKVEEESKIEETKGASFPEN